MPTIVETEMSLVTGVVSIAQGGTGVPMIEVDILITHDSRLVTPQVTSTISK